MHIGYRDFVDGQSRAIHVDDEGNQYVFDDAGEPIFGVWIAPDYDHAAPQLFRANLDDPPE
jgi:hypothetical protein